MKEAISKFKIGDLVTLDNKMKEMLGMDEDAIGIVTEVKTTSPDRYINEAYLICWHGNPYMNWDKAMGPSFSHTDLDLYLIFYGYELELVEPS